jgi:hypothetical protein
MKNPSRFISLSGIAIAAALLCRCDMQTAGSSVGTGNPTEIEVAFTGTDGAPKALTGTVDIYASTQVPVPGFQPEPLRSYVVDGESELVAKAEDFSSIPDSLWPRSSREGDSLYRFNVVVKGITEGAVIKGLGFRPGKTTFAIPEGLQKDPKLKSAVGVHAKITQLVAYTVMMDKGALTEFMDHYLFVAGTGFVAKNDNALFLFPALPKGSYEPSYLAVWQKGHGNQGGSDDSTGVYNLSSSFDTEKQDTLAIGSTRERIYLPSEFRGP